MERKHPANKRDIEAASANFRGLRILAELIAERYLREMKGQQPKHAGPPRDGDGENVP